ncbi:MAG: TorF family putative porin [Candidatus Thiodiazotropha sp.]
MNVNKLALACGVAMLGLSSVAAAEVSMNIGVTSNYIWRGMTQSANSSAFSGGLDWENASGFYAGTWISEAWTDYEMDLYGGYNGTAGDFGYGVGLIYYTYTADEDVNFAELGLSGSYQMLSFGLDYTITSEVDDTPAAEPAIDGDMHLYLGAAFDLPEDFTLGATVGQYAFEDDGVAGADLDFTYYQIDLSKSAGEFGDVTLSVSDTNINEDSNVGGEDGDMRFFVSWSKSI